jgi:hypothetical protein
VDTVKEWEQDEASVENSMVSPLGAGYGRGRGFGRGIQSPYISQNNPSYSKESEKEYIENEVSFLKEQLNALEGRLADMQEDE